MNTRICIALPLLLLSASARAADPPARAHFLALIDRPKVPPAPEFSPIPATTPFAESRFTFASDAHTRVPGLLVSAPAAIPIQKRPVVILLHGTGGSKQDMLPLARTLAAKGFIAVAIDGPYHGERTKAGAAGQSSKNTPDYQDALLAAYRNADPAKATHPFFIDTVWDVMRLIDYLETRPDVDPARIGIYGVSKGGIEAYLAAAADPRIACAVPCIALESFAWAADNNSWQSRIGTVQKAFDAAAKDAGIEKPDGKFVHAFYAKVAPGIDSEFDGPSMAPLIAPRPLLAINGERDPRTPAPGLKLATDATKAAYQATNAPDHFELLIEKNTPHKVTPEAQAAGVDFLVKWLKP
jgi:dienelactone hydrolase